MMVYKVSPPVADSVAALFTTALLSLRPRNVASSKTFLPFGLSAGVQLLR